MRTVLRVVSVLLPVVGTPAVVLAATALLYAWSAPVQPPPSMNEGPGMAGLLGLMLLVPSGAAVLVGVAMHLGLNATRASDDVEWARQHNRLW